MTFKIETIIPLYKKGEKEVSVYKPITLLNNIAKIEKNTCNLLG